MRVKIELLTWSLATRAIHMIVLVRQSYRHTLILSCLAIKKKLISLLKCKICSINCSRPFILFKTLSTLFILSSLPSSPFLSRSCIICPHFVFLLLTSVCVLSFAHSLSCTHSLTLGLSISQMEVEQLLSLSGPALAQAISSLLETPGLYVFSDILELPNVRELETGPHAPVYQLLNLFAYGTYCDYKERAASLPELTPAQRNKLRHLSIISLASNLKCLPYSLLLQQLELKNVRELEDLLIEAVYCDIIQGKLDQRNQQVEVDCSVGRDLGPNELPNIANTLQEWCSGCEAVLCGIEEQVTRANQYRESQLKVKVQVETEVSNLQKTLKASSASPSSGPAAAGATSNQDADQPAEPRDPASSQEPRQPGKKSSKVKGLRGSGKIWSKSN
uniref:PCI domain-containing protein n=1 Tax=Hucho hucho TaxID=62062 RepID=A0A4W5LAN1_9TELE